MESVKKIIEGLQKVEANAVAGCSGSEDTVTIARALIAVVQKVSGEAEKKGKKDRA